MVVVTGKSDLIHDPFDQTSYPPSEQRLNGVLRVAAGTVAAAASDSAGSKYLLARVPSDAILDDSTAFAHAAWAFAQVQIGTKSNPTALANVARGATVLNPNAFGDANHGKMLWEQLGLAKDPGGQIDLWAHAAAGATAAGTMKYRIAYRR